MKLLLDTHMLLWTTIWPERLPKKAQVLFGDKDNTIFFSPASLWEVAIKKKRGRPDFDEDARILRRYILDSGGIELPITSAHAIAVSDLPSIHSDPFDRILLAQTKEEGLTLVTADGIVAKYPVSVLHFPKRQPK